MKMVFRKFNDGAVIALFCNSASYCNPGNVMSYMRIGQHDEASRYLGRYLRLAKPDEYAPLLRELSSIYKTTITPVSRLVA